jgi:hypothetical protein
MSGLPSNTAIETTIVDGKMRVTISMTLETSDRAVAMIEAINNVVLPILKMAPLSVAATPVL